MLFSCFGVLLIVQSVSGEEDGCAGKKTEGIFAFLLQVLLLHGIIQTGILSKQQRRIRMETKAKEALALHEALGGKIATEVKMHASDKDSLSLLYTPGVAKPCVAIQKDPEALYRYTIKRNTVAVLTDGSAVLGLGNIGAAASLPVMEGKAMLFKDFAGVDAFPICVQTQDVDEIVMIARNIAPVFGAINLEDIASPRCVLVEEKLQEALDIPVFHDDQHGTAIVVAAGLLNALDVVGKRIEDVRIVLSGAGAAGASIAKMLHSLGARDLLVFWKEGIIRRGVAQENFVHEQLSRFTNPNNLDLSFAEAFVDADVFIGVSAGGIVSKEMVSCMRENAIVFALANPEPEIGYEEAKAAGAKVVATGRSDYPNQVNNVLAFPGIFRGALDAGATKINASMKLAAVKALAALIPPAQRTSTRILPDAFDLRVAASVSKAVAEAAAASGDVRKAVRKI